MPQMQWEQYAMRIQFFADEMHMWNIDFKYRLFVR